MSNPVLVEVTRGPGVESRHRAAVSVRDGDGAVVLAVGAVDAPVFPRSAVKAIQALPLVESGAADAFGFGLRELALAQASHSGESAHVETAAAMLSAMGLVKADLECGTHKPGNPAAAAELIRDGRRANQLHNNCSGKHCGFLAVARHLGMEHRDYVGFAHPVQEAVREAMQSLTGATHDASHRGTDGCSIPTYAVPLEALALGFARFATGRGLSAERSVAAERIFDAAVREPYLVAGEGRFDTEVMRLLDGAVLVKTGAEGGYCAAIPQLGFGVAAKCEDGATRASEAVMAAVLAHLLPDYAEGLRRWTHAPVLTRRGAPVGEIRAVAGSLAPLS